ncbi:MAG: hypothetical protein GY856_50505 [bacterium]|nr:hypothetical protein [bacterium]
MANTATMGVSPAAALCWWSSGRCSCSRVDAGLRRRLGFLIAAGSQDVTGEIRQGVELFERFELPTEEAIRRRAGGRCALLLALGPALSPQTWDDTLHVFQQFELPEANQAIAGVGEFVRRLFQ